MGVDECPAGSTMIDNEAECEKAGNVMKITKGPDSRWTGGVGTHCYFCIGCGNVSAFNNASGSKAQWICKSNNS